MLFIGILLFGMLVGAVAQLILHKGADGINWPMAFATGIIGSFVGGLLLSLVSGDGIQLRTSGIIGSIVGAVICVLAWEWFQGRRTTTS